MGGLRLRCCAWLWSQSSESASSVAGPPFYGHVHVHINYRKRYALCLQAKLPAQSLVELAVNYLEWKYRQLLNYSWTLLLHRVYWACQTGSRLQMCGAGA